MEIPFEECQWVNESYTDRIVDENKGFPLSDASLTTDDTGKIKDNLKESLTEEKRAPWEDYNNFPEFFLLSEQNIDFFKNDIPMECFFASAVRGAGLYGASSENFYFCAENSINPGNMSVTDDDDQPRVIYPRRACLNKSYMELTMRAFNETADCFGFSKMEKEGIFILLNHESSFLHNSKSPTGAKCYGQLTKETIKEINKQIYFRDVGEGFPYSYIFDEVMSRCLGLKAAVLSGEFTESVDLPGKNKSMEKFENIISRTPVSCKTTQNLYSCLFYTFYNIKKNKDKITSQLNKLSSSGNKDISEELKEKFLLPIKLKEMLIITDENNRVMVFGDDSELWSTSIKDLPPEKLKQIRKVSLFANEKEMTELFGYWAYNGGITFALEYMTDFIEQLKQSIAIPCSLDSKEKICQYRMSIQDGQGLSTSDVKNDFQAYLQEHYISEMSDKDADNTESEQEEKDRKEEVVNFVDDVAGNLNYLYDKTSEFKKHLKELIPSLEDHQIETFQSGLKSICPEL